MSKKDGGAAFPRPAGEAHADGEVYINDSASGMSLRDWFAGQVLGGIYASGSIPARREFTAYTAYKMADAMLEEREEAV